MQLKVKAIHESTRTKKMQYATDGSAGLDLIAAIDTNIVLKPQEIIIVPAGICIELPKGYEAQIRPRSGLSSKGILVMLGTIDSDYRGEIGVITSNISKHDFEICPGMRIAQMVIAQHATASLEYVEELTPTERNQGGFGSTGLF